MKPSLSTLAVATGATLGFASKHLRSNRPSPGASAMRRLTAYFIFPMWLGAGFVDYLWHRRTRIETTSGLKEALIHSLMMAEACPVVLPAMFFEINSSVLRLMIAGSLIHELTVLGDLRLTAPHRPIPAGEQITHTFLEMPPFLVTAAAICTHWDQFLALLGRARARRGFHLERPPVPLSEMALMFAAIALLGALPHFDELRRCWRARQAGAAEQNVPACLEEAPAAAVSFT